MFPIQIGGSHASFNISRLLRFEPVQLREAGRYRVCFCDYTLSRTGSCETAEDYSLDVGYVYSSGVTCMLSEERYLAEEKLRENVVCYTARRR